MALDEIMEQAAEYVTVHLGHIGTRPGPLDLSELINDAANIYSVNYDVYVSVSDELTRRFLFA